MEITSVQPPEGTSEVIIDLLVQAGYSYQEDHDDYGSELSEEVIYCLEQAFARSNKLTDFVHGLLNPVMKLGGYRGVEVGVTFPTTMGLWIKNDNLYWGPFDSDAILDACDPQDNEMVYLRNSDGAVRRYGWLKNAHAFL